jgi:protein ImuB
VEERWWDAATARRLARLHVTTDDGAAWLVAREAGRWWAEAAYR